MGDSPDSALRLRGSDSLGHPQTTTGAFSVHAESIVPS
jgi:hypothetical protein